jgi:AraC-like DNA-binding protein
MNPSDQQSAVPLLRVASLLRYVRYLEAVGAPVGPLLTEAKIPALLLDHPEAAVTWEHAFRFGELACRTLGTEHLGLYVGQASLLEDLGAYGAILQRALTLHEYLHKGIRLYNMLATHQRLWLSEAGGDVLRFNISTIGEAGIAAYQSQLETLVVTIATTRDAAGPDWSPREISIAYRSRERLPEIELFAGSRVITGTGETYFTIPRPLLQRHLWRRKGATPPNSTSTFIERTLPEDLYGLVQLQLEQLLTDRAFGIETVAESLMMSRRSLQRSLAHQGLSFSQILAETRLRQATDWLTNTDKPVGEIAFDLGYRDASNFTRAFRRQTGVPPQLFRDNAGQQ